jgi:hypothetical protein
MEELKMEHKKTLIAAILSLFIAAGAGYVLCTGIGVDGCLYQPSITDVGSGSFDFKVKHNTTYTGCEPYYCNHSCDTSDGTITVTVYNSSRQRKCGPYDMICVGSDTCYYQWVYRVSDCVLQTGDIVKFDHPEYLNCSCEVTW